MPVYSLISINSSQIEFTSQAEQVGVLRSGSGNLPNILQRVASFKKTLGSLLSCGFTKGHTSNPVASLKILNTFATPVLLSGLNSLVLSVREIGQVVDLQ